MAEVQTPELEQLIATHANWVYASARRRVGRADLAEDVTQAVFILLWRKWPGLGGQTRLTGWLYRAIGYCSANVMKRQRIRVAHEREAAMIRPGQTTTERWSDVEGELEAAVDRLRERDRQAILLRFYRGMSHLEVGQAMGISEEAAKMRVGRAIERLRVRLERRGVAASSAGLSAIVLANVSPAAPGQLVQAMLGGVGGGGSAAANAIAKGAIKMMAWSTAKVAATVFLSASAVAGVGTSYVMIARNSADSAAVAQAQMPMAQRPAMVAGQAPATTSATDAAKLFLQAVRAIAVQCPASSDLVYPAYPPMGDAWTALASRAWKANGKTRDLARQARPTDRANWAAGNQKNWLGGLRALSLDLGDAALYAHLEGQDAAAIELLRDNLHLARLLRKDTPPDELVRPLVAGGFDAVGMDRLLQIVSAVKLTADPADGQALQITAARQLIRELLDQQSPEDQLKQILGSEYEAAKSDPARGHRMLQIVATVNRSNAERTMAAMSLACHLFRADKGRWPASLDELLATYLPAVPADPWGDGTQTFAYVLIKGGLPDGSDRPLVYCRLESQDGLFFRIDAPQYSFYQGNPREKPPAEQKRGGQFRDVAQWVPVPGRRLSPSTQPLP